ncbi:MAG: ScyD/ScyE family protein, partial [Chloroflexi bacterium]|nr:ScyD/ScyE family protein [Chloroflexota bacterium]
MSRIFRIASVAALAALAVLTAVGPAQAASSHPFVVVASGLENPRGLKFGPDGQLYVAEGGLGGTQTTTPQDCQQVPPPVGPYSGGFTARISKIDRRSGARSTVVDHLPSSQTAPGGGGFVSGVGDVAFIDDTLYAVEAGAGCSHGLKGTVNSILRVDHDGHTTQVADLSAFIMSHPVAHPNPPDFEPDGTWYSMVAVDGRLYVVEPNHGEIDAVTPRTGAISRLVDVSASQGHIVPTSLAREDGGFLLGNLGQFVPNDPVPVGVWRVTDGGRINLVAAGLTAVTGVAVHHGRIYALEAFTGFFAPTPAVANTGTVVRLNQKANAWETVVTGLSFPTAMTFDEQGELFIS